MVGAPNPDPGGQGLRALRRSHRRWRPRQPQFTRRDFEIVTWITRHGVVTMEQVAAKFFWHDHTKPVGMWAAYRRLAVLRGLGLLLTDKPFAATPALLRVTRRGAELADVGLRPAPLVITELRHTVAVVSLCEQLLARHPEADLTTERELRAERYRERREHLRPPGRGRIPDALLRIPKEGGNEETIAVELDLSRKERREVERIVRAYDQEPVDRVWWYVRPVRLARVREIVRQLRADDRIQVLEWPD